MSATYVVRHGQINMPFFPEVGAFLWGEADYDSDGDARRPADPEWTELDISRRDQLSRTVAIKGGQGDERASLVEADDANDARLAALFLAERTGGAVFDDRGTLVQIAELRNGFSDLDSRFADANAVRERLRAD